MKEVIFIQSSTMSSAISYKKKAEEETKMNFEKEEDSESIQSAKQQVYKYLHNDLSQSESVSSTSHDIIAQKATLNIDSVPLSLLNLRRAIILFFLTLMATSFSLLAVIQVSYSNFSNQMQTVQQALLINNYQTDLRLTYMMMLMISNENYEYQERDKQEDFLYLRN